MIRFSFREKGKFERWKHGAERKTWDFVISRYLATVAHILG